MAGIDESLGLLKDNPADIFDVIDKLGEGAYGAVYKCRRRTDGRIVAVKLVPMTADIVGLRRELEILRECKSEWIIDYQGAYSKDGDLWIVMEYMSGGSVSDVVEVLGTLKENVIACIAHSMLQGLAYLHSQRKIHRDIKAGNILLDDSGSSKLADFGVSAELKDALDKKQTVIGTPFWMAPEVIQESSYDGRADIWSLGITCIEMAEGEPPYYDVHPMRAIFMIPANPPPTLKEKTKWSPLFIDFLSTCLTKDPKFRPDAVTLLEHPFVKNVGPKIAPCIQEIVKEYHEKAPLMEDDDDDDDDDDQPAPAPVAMPATRQDKLTGKLSTLHRPRSTSSGSGRPAPVPAPAPARQQPSPNPAPRAGVSRTPATQSRPTPTPASSRPGSSPGTRPTPTTTRTPAVAPKPTVSTRTTSSGASPASRAQPAPAVFPKAAPDHLRVAASTDQVSYSRRGDRPSDTYTVRRLQILRDEAEQDQNLNPSDLLGHRARRRGRRDNAWASELWDAMAHIENDFGTEQRKTLSAPKVDIMAGKLGVEALDPDTAMRAADDIANALRASSHAPSPVAAPAAAPVSVPAANSHNSIAEVKGISVFKEQFGEDHIIGEVIVSSATTVTELLDMIKAELQIPYEFKIKKNAIPIAAAQHSRKALEFFRGESDYCVICETSSGS
eukprot:c8324_g1_i2.p1 GENE.c8324_g1_i2~~c8324_g1_i2.p1  ORF type:complete len:669 (-),score=169.03 c8324_g1_i2:311-2317(-)